MTDEFIKKCPVCRKEFTIQHPSIWAYKRKSFYPVYFCSWHCLREDEKKEEKTMHGRVSLEQKKKAVEIALAGGDYLKYLKEIGSKQPPALWYSIKKNLQKADPEKYEQLAAALEKKTPKAPEAKPVVEEDQPTEPDATVTVSDALQNCMDAANEFFGKCEEAGLKFTDPEPKITKPVNYDGFSVRAVEGEYGNYHFQEINGKKWLDYDDKECANEMSMTVEQWRGFLDEIRKAALILGVEL